MKIPNYTLGLVTGFCLCVLYFMVPAIVDGFRVEPAEATPPKPIVEVVGTYKDCEIIQYTNENLARYSYMLYCGDQK
jgi:hypothetical protein